MKNKIKKFLVKGNISNQDNRKSAGITLVALIVTIIILLILAGITISSLTNVGLFDKVKEARDKWQNAQNEEEMQLARYSNEIDSYVDGNRETVTISKEDYDKLMKKGYTLLWEGVANKVGSADSNGNNYVFKESSMDVENYDFVLIEYYQSNIANQLSTSSLVSKSTIIKNKSSNIALLGYGTRYTAIKFVDGGFVVDEIEGDGDCYEYITKITGINM